ncbi:MAG: hypothetical protein KatS3mg084_0077 [Candidatus Dojkabacteria bacterium]|nr:MAG: hypothetical protein KatS3mg084_0077 [Candidatus Dojkabacteria bacterium]
MDEKKIKPFNLLYKSDVQLTFIDKLYDIVLGPVRLVVLLVMSVILGVFAWRFSLDARLNDLIKDSRILSNRWQTTVAPNLTTYMETQNIVSSLRNYIELYRSEEVAITQDVSKNVDSNKLVKSGSILTEIKQVENNFANRVTVANYTIIIDSEPKVRLTGGASTFTDIDNFVTDLKNMEFVRDVIIPSQTADKGDIPRFTIEILLR